MGGSFVAWVLFFFFLNLLIEDLAKGKVFLKGFHTKKRQENFGGYHHN
jgi:hypothetical protein